jgi:hypothetical protein
LIELGYKKFTDIKSDAGDNATITREYRESIGTMIADCMRMKKKYAIIPAVLVPEAADVGSYLPHTHIFYIKD